MNKKRTIIQNVQRTFETQQRENEQHDFKKMSQDLKIYFTKEDIQMADKHMKKCSPSYVSRGLEIKAIMRYQHIYLSGQNPKH